MSGTILTILVAAILGYAGAVKVADPEGFALAISYYNLLPRQGLQPLAYILPALEVVVALALFTSAYRRAAWVLAGGLFLTFAGAVGSAVVRGLDVSCGCFGGAMTVSWYHLVGNLALTALCVWQFQRLSRSDLTDRCAPETPV
jgi:hypothetical protein